MMYGIEKEMIEDYGVESSVWIGGKRIVLGINEENTEKPRYMSCIVTDNGLFERLLVQFKTDKGYDERYVYMLTKQGRMHRDIAEFPNQAFYGNKLDIVPLEHQTLPTVRKDSANSIITMLTTHRIAFVAARPTVLSPSAKTNKTEAQMIAAAVRAIYELTSEGFD